MASGFAPGEFDRPRASRSCARTTPTAGSRRTSRGMAGSRSSRRRFARCRLRLEEAPTPSCPPPRRRPTLPRCQRPDARRAGRAAGHARAAARPGAARGRSCPRCPGISLLALGVLLLVVALIAAAVVAIAWRRGLHGWPPYQRPYAQLVRLGGWSGTLRRDASDTPFEVAERLGRQVPRAQAAIDELTGAYVEGTYSSRTAGARSLADLAGRAPRRDARAVRPPLGRLVRRGHVGRACRRAATPSCSARGARRADYAERRRRARSRVWSAERLDRNASSARSSVRISVARADVVRIRDDPQLFRLFGGLEQRVRVADRARSRPASPWVIRIGRGAMRPMTSIGRSWSASTWTIHLAQCMAIGASGKCGTRVTTWKLYLRGVEERGVRAVGDHDGDVGAARGGLNRRRGAHRKADDADAFGVDLGPLLQILRPRRCTSLVSWWPTLVKRPPLSPWARKSKQSTL